MNMKMKIPLCDCSYISEKLISDRFEKKEYLFTNLDIRLFKNIRMVKQIKK